MRSRLVFFALLAVAVGCGSFDAPSESTEPAPAAGAPAPAEAPADDSTSSSETATSPSATEPASGSGAGTSPSVPCKVGFQKDILPRLSETCGTATCHGAQLNRPFIESASPKTTHDELMEFQFGSIEWSDPHSEYSGAGVSDFKKAIDQWRMCGAPFD